MVQKGGGDCIRRNNLCIALEILKVAMKGAKKTQIVYGVNLNSALAEKYLETLESNQLIERKDNLFVTTEKGRAYRVLASELDLKFD